MTDDTLQESLFEDPLGLRFRHARERLRWSLEAAAQQLKLPVAVLDAIEREDWARLGPAIFARSYVSSYARLLGLSPALADEAVPGRAQPELVAAVGSVPARRVVRRPRGARRFLVMLAVVAGLLLAAWAAGLPELARGWIGSSSAAAVSPPSARRDVSAIAASAAGTGTAATDGATAIPPLAASGAAAFPSAASAPSATSGAGELVLHFRGDSWIEVLAPDGATVERGLVAAGAERRFAPGTVGQVTLGDAAAVEVSRDGATLAAGPPNAAKVSRFTVSSDGSIHPSAID